ncbi:UNVERIFIED_ORG: hypothetical protein BDK47_1187 [Anoxybacillus amylolyticus]
MDSRAIDRLVAEKVMGWVQGEYAKDKWYYKKNEQIQGMAKFINDWNPSTNIADAWQVVEKFEIVEINRIMDGYSCEITLFDPFRIRRGEAKTAPLAICLAALKAVGVDVEV